MKAYKLMRLTKKGELKPLFIPYSGKIQQGIYYAAEFNPKKGFAPRKGWHCTLLPSAPHLKMNLKSGECRVWVEVNVLGADLYDRPKSQGGTWVLASWMKVVRILTPIERYQILAQEKIKSMTEDELKSIIDSFI